MNTETYTRLRAAHRMKDLGARSENFTFLGWDLLWLCFRSFLFIHIDEAGAFGWHGGIGAGLWKRLALLYSSGLCENPLYFLAILDGVVFERQSWIRSYECGTQNS